jgi:hypothetical protein
MNVHKDKKIPGAILKDPEHSLTFESTCERPEIQDVNVFYSTKIKVKTRVYQDRRYLSKNKKKPSIVIFKKYILRKILKRFNLALQTTSSKQWPNLKKISLNFFIKLGTKTNCFFNFKN